MDKLVEIMAWKRQELAARLRPVRPAELEQLGARRRLGPGFTESLRRSRGLAVIAEIKRRSPSAGPIAEEADAAEQARKYYNAGADAVSVLTDEKFFGGSIRDLWEVNDLLGGRDDARPTLRKDFFVHPLQVVEAAEAGARAILLIVRALSDEELQALREAADLARLDCLYEIHEESELERALALGARLIGVNNRDLRRFKTDLAISERLLPLIPRHLTAVSESGIAGPEEAARARAAGAHAVLIGEALMKSEDPDRFIEDLHAID